MSGAYSKPKTATFGWHRLKSHEPAPPERLADRLPLRILLAEDSPVNQRVGLALLAREGYQADVAANGLDVLKALAEQTYNAILMDVQMPEMDGLEATRQICLRWPAERRPRIIAMTANAMDGDKETCLVAGMGDYISKPVRKGELVSALERCANISSGPRRHTS